MATKAIAVLVLLAALLLIASEGATRDSASNTGATEHGSETDQYGGPWGGGGRGGYPWGGRGGGGYPWGGGGRGGYPWGGGGSRWGPGGGGCRYRCGFRCCSAAEKAEYDAQAEP